MEVECSSLSLGYNAYMNKPMEDRKGTSNMEIVFSSKWKLI
jgi:hypothetical protein